MASSGASSSGARTGARRTSSARSTWACTALLAFSFAWSPTSSQYGTPGEDLFKALGIAQVLCLGALSLFLAHFALAAEKTSGRLDLLLVTGKTSAGIVGGKIAGALVLPLFLLLAGLPAMLVAVALGGVSGTDVLVLAGAVLTLILLMGSLGAVGGSAASLGLTFALPAVYVFGPVLAAAMELPGFDDDEILGYCWLPFAFLEILDAPISSSLPGVVASSLALSGLCLSVSILLLPRPRSAWLARSLRAFGHKASEWNRRLGRGVVLLKSRNYHLLWSRPLLWREEFRSPVTNVTGRARLIAILILGYASFWWLMLARLAPCDRDYASNIVECLSGLVLLVAPGMCAANWAAVDRERRVLHILLSSPARGRDIVLASVRSTVTLFSIPLAFLVLHELTGWVFRVPESDGRAAAVALSGIVFGSSFGAMCGYYARTTTRAVLGFLVALLIWNAGVGAAILLDLKGLCILRDVAACTSPAFVLLNVVSPFRWDSWPVWPSVTLGCLASATALYLSVRRLRAWLE